MLPTLDARLTAAAELVLPGKPVADIGCDHGKLTAVLAASGKYPRVIGADLRPGPLAKAEQTLEYAGCKDRAELRLGDGLSVLSPGEVSTIVLAGVSAQTTWEIIEKAPWVSAPGGPRLVMVPATRHSDLRRRVLTKRTAAALQALLAGVVAGGTGHEAALPGQTAAGKTGTAQTGQFSGGTELKNYWFAGFVPAEQPRYTIVVLQDTQADPAFSSAAIFARVAAGLEILAP